MNTQRSSFGLVVVSMALVAVSSAGCGFPMSDEQIVEGGRRDIETRQWSQRQALRYRPHQKQITEALLANGDIIACLVGLRPACIHTDVGERPAIEFSVWLRATRREEGQAETKERLRKLVREAIEGTNLPVDTINSGVAHEDQWLIEGWLELPTRSKGAAKP